MPSPLPDPLFDIGGKSIVVAGAGGGLGREITKALDERGANLTLADIDVDQFREFSAELSGNACVTAVDITDEASANAMAKAAIDAYGRVDAVINAAGVLSIAPALELSPDDFRRSLEINVTGALMLSRAAANHMSDDGGSIVHIASVSSLVANRNYASYASSKAALSQLVRVLAREWAERGIRVNALGPAMTETDLNRQFLADPDFQAQALGVIPMGRFGTPDDLFGALLLLIAPGGGFITGQTLYVDGGRTLV